jgi:hypothetical protein
LAGWTDAHAQDIIAQSGDLHDGGAGVDFNSVGGCPGSGDPVEPHEARFLRGFGGGFRLTGCG